jgi:hypothetical protein
MKKTPFIWLGSGRAKKRGVSRRGRQLDAVAGAGLPVPVGAILLDELFRIFLQEGIIEYAGEKVIVPDPIWLLEVLYRDVRFPHLKNTVDITVIPGNEFDGLLPSEAIVHQVNLEEANELAVALGKVWSYPAPNNEFRHDVSIVTRIESETTGRALSSPDGNEDVITVFSGHTSEKIHLPRLGRWKRPSQEAAPYERRLQMLLRGVRRTLGNEAAIDFNWQDDGQVCWITLFN